LQGLGGNIQEGKKETGEDPTNNPTQVVIKTVVEKYVTAAAAEGGENKFSYKGV